MLPLFIPPEVSFGRGGRPGSAAHRQQSDGRSQWAYFSMSTRMKGAGNGKLESPSTSVAPSNRIVAVAVAARSLRLDPGALTVDSTGPVPIQRATTETVCNAPRLSGTLS